MRSNLVEVDSDRRVAYFQDLDDPEKKPTGVEASCTVSYFGPVRARDAVLSF